MLAGASAKLKGQRVDPRAKGKAKAITKAGRGTSKLVYQSTLPYSSRNGSVPGSPMSKKRKGVELYTPPAAPRQLSPRSIAMMSSSPSQAVGLGLGAGPNTPVDAATGCVFAPGLYYLPSCQQRAREHVNERKRSGKQEKVGSPAHVEFPTDSGHVLKVHVATS